MLVNRNERQLIGILSDAHGNVEAFDRAVNVLRRHGAKRFVYLGDAVGYFPGTAVVHRLVQMSVKAVMGNHERMLLDANTPPDRDTVYQLARTFDLMPPDLIMYLRTLPEYISTSFPSGKVLFVHGSPQNPVNGYIHRDTDLLPLTVDLPEGTTVFVGHTHRPFVRNERGVCFVNVGSCALPRDDGTYGAACLFDGTSGQVRILRFNIAAEWDSVLARCQNVHDSIKTLRERRDQFDLVGEIV